MIIVVFITLFFLTVAPCYYFKKNLREFIFHLKLHGALKISNRSILRLSVLLNILCNFIITSVSLIITAATCLGYYSFFMGLPRRIEPSSYIIQEKSGQYLYFDVNACYKSCIYRQDTDENYCGPMILLPVGTKVTRTGFVPASMFGGNTFCYRVQTTDGLEGWL